MFRKIVVTLMLLFIFNGYVYVNLFEDYKKHHIRELSFYKNRIIVTGGTGRFGSELKKIKMLCRIDTKNELEYYKHGGILQYVLRSMI